MTEQEILLVMTLMALLDKPVSVQRVQETYMQQKQILAEMSNTAEPVRDKSPYEQRGVRIIGMEDDQ
jgi:hypothetical protein